MYRTNPEFDLRQRTKRFALEVITLFGKLPASPEAHVIGKQLLRSGTSVGANYREAFRARSSAECIAKLGICVQEAEETLYWLELLLEANLIKEQQIRSLLDEVDQLIAIFVSSIKRQKAKIGEDNLVYDVNLDES